MRYRVAYGFLSLALVGCAHTPETVVHLSGPPGGAWTVREPGGAPVCTLPCSVELDEHETVVVHHPRGRQFVLHQASLGKGVWNGSIRVRREPGTGALAMQAFSGALASAGTTMMMDHRNDRAAAGIVLTGLGAVGMLASEKMAHDKIEELWLEQISAR